MVGAKAANVVTHARPAVLRLGGAWGGGGGLCSGLALAAGQSWTLWGRSVGAMALWGGGGKHKMSLRSLRGIRPKTDPQAVSVGSLPEVATKKLGSLFGESTHGFEQVVLVPGFTGLWPAHELTLWGFPVVYGPFGRGMGDEPKFSTKTWGS